jgi:hypothetical protein
VITGRGARSNSGVKLTACRQPRAETVPRSGPSPMLANELLGAVVLSIAPPYVRDRTDDKLFERRSIKISKLLEVQASLAHLVLAKLGQ